MCTISKRNIRDNHKWIPKSNNDNFVTCKPPCLYWIPPGATIWITNWIWVNTSPIVLWNLRAFTRFRQSAGTRWNQGDLQVFLVTSGWLFMHSTSDYPHLLDGLDDFIKVERYSISNFVECIFMLCERYTG